MITIEEIMSLYGSYIYCFALKLSTNPDIAKEMTQITFINAWKNLEQLTEPRAIKKWLRMICYNEWKQYLRKNNQLRIDPYETIETLENDAHYFQDNNPSPIEEVIVKDEIAKLRNGCFLAMTRKLTFNQRVAFSLIDMFGLSIYEVSELLDISPQAVKGLLYRARINLDSFFQEHCYFIDIHNACRCEAWLSFIKDRDSFQKKMRETIDVLNSHDKTHHFDHKTRQKVMYYYQHMPNQRPNDEWFKNLIKIIRKL